MNRNQTVQPARLRADKPPAVDEPANDHEPSAPVLASADVLRGHKAVAITHNGTQYRLQTTRQGKLILTK